MHGPIDDHNRDDVMEASLLRPFEEESGPSSSLEEETTLLEKGDGPSGAPGSSPQQAKNPSLIGLLSRLLLQSLPLHPTVTLP